MRSEAEQRRTAMEIMRKGGQEIADAAAAKWRGDGYRPTEEMRQDALADWRTIRAEVDQLFFWMRREFR